MNTKHTPGPWYVGHGTASIYADGVRIADIVQSRTVSDPTDANARLIKTAPSMLEALQHAVETEEGNWDGVDDEPSWIQQARELIAQATGAQS